MPPFEFKSVEIRKASAISWSGERPVFQLSEEIVSQPTLTVPGLFLLADRSEIDVYENFEARFPTFEVTEAGLFPVKSSALMLVGHENRALVKPTVAQRYGVELIGVATSALVGGVAAGIATLLGAASPFIWTMVAVITGFYTGLGVLAGAFYRSWMKPYDIPEDGAKNRYRIRHHGSPWIPIPPEGALIAYPVQVKKTEDGEGLEVSFKIFGMERPLILKMGHSYAGHRHIHLSQDLRSAPNGYYLFMDRENSYRRLRPSLLESWETQGELYRANAPSTPSFTEGFDPFGNPVRIYRPGEEPREAQGKNAIVVRREVHQSEGREYISFYFQEGEEIGESEIASNYVTLSLEEAKRMGWVIQETDGVLRPNPFLPLIFVERS